MNNFNDYYNYLNNYNDMNFMTNPNTMITDMNYQNSSLIIIQYQIQTPIVVSQTHKQDSKEEIYSITYMMNTKIINHKS